MLLSFKNDEFFSFLLKLLFLFKILKLVSSLGFAQAMLRIVGASPN